MGVGFSQLILKKEGIVDNLIYGFNWGIGFFCSAIIIGVGSWAIFTVTKNILWNNTVNKIKKGGKKCCGR